MSDAYASMLASIFFQIKVAKRRQCVRQLVDGEMSRCRALRVGGAGLRANAIASNASITSGVRAAAHIDG